MGWDAAGHEGNTLGHTLTSALASPLVWSDLMCPIPVHWHSEVLVPAASQLARTWSQPQSIFTALAVQPRWKETAGQDFSPALFIAFLFA